jgi:hypothetical protein
MTVLKLYDVCADKDMAARTTKPKPSANDLSFMLFLLFFLFMRA